MQGFTPAINHDPEHSIEERSTHSAHSAYETIAQGLCTTMTIINGEKGCTYAVRRYCSRYRTETCSDLCSARRLAQKDSQYSRRAWRSIGAVHVYERRPHSLRSTVINPTLGFKVLWYNNYHTQGSCGPNYCCCFVPLENLDAYGNE